jgi:hypothetical protein
MYPAKLSFIIEGKIATFYYKLKLKKLMTKPDCRRHLLELDPQNSKCNQKIQERTNPAR